MHIEPAEVMALSRAIRGIYDASAVPAFHTRVMRAVTEIAPADIVSFNEIDPRCGSLVYFDEPFGACSFDPDAQAIFLSCVHEHPLARRRDPRRAAHGCEDLRLPHPARLSEAATVR
ncbi:MAG: hypothetical protein IPG04_41900 [Polyangiaceae bacterium]|nr:hypothetical protein [Polyangiaceae bacterium]